MAALVVALVASVAVLDTDLLRAAGIPWAYERDPTARLARLAHARRGRWNISATTRSANSARPSSSSPTATRSPPNLISTLPTDAPPGAGHPPVYLPESQNLETQFSFWPGYDQVVAPSSAASTRREPAAQRRRKSSAASAPARSSGAARFTSPTTTATATCPDAVERGFEECALVAQYEIQRHGQPLRHVRIYACFNYRGLDL